MTTTYCKHGCDNSTWQNMAGEEYECDQCWESRQEEEGKKSLAQLKRDIAKGVNIRYLQIVAKRYNNKTRTYTGKFIQEEIPEKRQGIRYVSHVDTTGFYMKQSDNRLEKGSFCAWPKAVDVAYIGNTFVIADRHNRSKEPYMMRTYEIVRYE